MLKPNYKPALHNLLCLIYRKMKTLPKQQTAIVPCATSFQTGMILLIQDITLRKTRELLVSASIGMRFMLMIFTNDLTIMGYSSQKIQSKMVRLKKHSFGA